MKIVDLFEEEKRKDLVGYKYNGYPSDPEKIWVGNFSCKAQGLTSLKGAPIEVNGDFEVYVNHLANLKHGPFSVHGKYNCSNNLMMTSLEGAPKYVGKSFYCSNSGLTSLDSGPAEVNGNFYASGCKKITSLHNIHKSIKRINGILILTDCPIERCVLGLLKINTLQEVDLWNVAVQNIINKHLPKGDLVECQQELIEAGFEEYAQL